MLSETAIVTKNIENFRICSESLVVEAREAPWDTAVFNYAVVQIDRLDVKNAGMAREEFLSFKDWVHSNDVGLVSCRLSCKHMAESMLLEDNEFKFIEAILHPVCTRLANFKDAVDTQLVIERPAEADLPELVLIAECAFTNERYYVDPRVDTAISGKRYGRWVVSAFFHATQQLLKVVHENKIVAFFIVERLSDQSVYWHLTAVNPQYQGKGYGRRVWLAMLARHHRENAVSVRTTIAARNVPVLNLYSSLNFRFAPPDMTFHWVKKSDQPILQI